MRVWRPLGKPVAFSCSNSQFAWRHMALPTTMRSGRARRNRIWQVEEEPRTPSPAAVISARNRLVDHDHSSVRLCAGHAGNVRRRATYPHDGVKRARRTGRDQRCFLCLSH
jgi:hypothetical protein